MKKKKSFKEVLAEIESPQDWGNGSWALPPNATLAEKLKYGICQKILAYQQDNNLDDEIMSRTMHLTIHETEDILFCRISKFSLETLINAAAQVFSISKIGLSAKSKEQFFHVSI